MYVSADCLPWDFPTANAALMSLPCYIWRLLILCLETVFYCSNTVTLFGLFLQFHLGMESA